MPKQDGTGTGWVYVRRKKTKAGEPGHWSDKKKTEVLTTYLATGNYSLTAAATGVPLETVKLWRRQDWWKEGIASFREDNTYELDAKLAKIVDKSINAINDRLENGDYHYDPRTGQMTRVHPKLRDVHIVTKDLIDRQTLLRKSQQTKEVIQRKESTDDRLLKLAETFAQLALGAKPKEEKIVNNVIEGEFETLPEHTREALENAIYVKRQEGLQEGATMGAQEKENSREG